MPVMFALGMSISVLTYQQPENIVNTIQKEQKLQSTHSQNQRFVRMQYQKNSKHIENTKAKDKTVVTEMITDTNFLARVATKEDIVELNKTTPDQKMHPLNAPQTSKVRLKEKVIKKTQTDKTRGNKQIASKKENIDITNELKELQIIVNNLETRPTKERKKQNNRIATGDKSSKDVNQVGYWQTVYSIESKQGKLLYRPRNKARNCNFTLGPCGHHQLTVQALRDVGCKSLQCRKDRLDYNKSLKLSKKLLALNEKRLKKDGLTNLQGYQKYLIHQQGANGIKNIIAATKGKKELSKTIKKNMANNSPYSYRQFKKMGSKIAAKKFMQHWERKWMSEKRLILASNSKITNNQRNSLVIPTFNDNDLNYALTLLF